MIKQNHRSIVLLILLVSFSFHPCAAKIIYAEDPENRDIFNKKDITIILADSGLGGLSTMAEIVEKLRESRSFRSADFIFVNTLFPKSSSDNNPYTRQDKVRIFNSTLGSMEQRFKPDMILIGCGSLSSLYKDTSFSQCSRTPVLGIVDSGIELISKNLKAYPESKVILFRTQAALEENSLKSLLLEQGFLPDRICTQACQDLISHVKRGFDSEEAEMLILSYVDEALKRIQDPYSSLFISLNCTHYDHTLDLWKQAFKSFGIEQAVYIDPYKKLSDFFNRPETRNRSNSTAISIQIVSMVDISQSVRTSVGEWLRERSPQTALALFHYKHQPNLFKWHTAITPDK